MAVQAPERLHYTGVDEADELIAQDPFALLVGFALDQQVPVPKAFSGPMELQKRLGHLDPGRIAATDPDELVEVFVRRPAIHRFPAAMAKRVQSLCAVIERDYGGDGSRVWTEAADAADLKARLAALPGIGDMKVRSLFATIVKRLGYRPDGWEEALPNHPTLGDVDSAEALATYQAEKRAYKAAQRAAKSS